MIKYNLLKQKKITRTLNRSSDKELNRTIALKFEQEYFDGPRSQGYGGYYYDGRWQTIAKRIVKKWSLTDNSNLLDIGCAKGFLLQDLFNLNNKINLYGIEISQYAIDNSDECIRKKIIKANCVSLPFENNFFDAVFAINTLHNLPVEDCKMAIKEIERIAPGKGFIQVDAYRTEQERELFMDWMLTAKTFNTPEGWRSIFKECGFTGKYYWTILEHE